MRVVEVKEDVSDAKCIRLHHITDPHVGKPDFSEKDLRERIALIEKDPNARWTMGGDGADLIAHRDRRYSPTELDMRYRVATDIRQASKEHLVELFKPIASKCWGWADGNHERAMDNWNGGMFGVEVCCALGIEDRWVGYRGFVHVNASVTKTQRVSQLLDLQHGWQVGRLKGAPHVQAEREFSITDADVLLRGHNHQPAAHTFVTLGVGVGGGGINVTRRYRTMINGGSWCLGYRPDLEPVDPEKLSEVEGDLWHETKGFRAEPVGGPVLLMRYQINNGHTSTAGCEHTVIEGSINEHSLGMPV